MKRFFEIMVNDYRREGFTRRDWLVYGLIGPALVVLIAIIGG